MSGILRPFIEAAPLKAIYDSLIFVGPNILHALVVFLSSSEGGGGGGGAAPLSRGLVYVGCLFAASSLQTFTLHQYFHRCYRTGMRVRTAD